MMRSHACTNTTASAKNATSIARNKTSVTIGSFFRRSRTGSATVESRAIATPARSASASVAVREESGIETPHVASRGSSTNRPSVRPRKRTGRSIPSPGCHSAYGATPGSSAGSTMRSCLDAGQESIEREGLEPAVAEIEPIGDLRARWRPAGRGGPGGCQGRLVHGASQSSTPIPGGPPGSLRPFDAGPSDPHASLTRAKPARAAACGLRFSAPGGGLRRPPAGSRPGGLNVRDGPKGRIASAGVP